MPTQVDSKMWFKSEWSGAGQTQYHTSQPQVRYCAGCQSGTVCRPRCKVSYTNTKPPSINWKKPHWSFVVVVFPGWTLWGLPSTCNCTLTNAFHRVRGLHVSAFLGRLLPSHTGSPCHTQRIYLLFGMVDAATWGVYHRWRQSPHNYAVPNTV